MHWIRHDSNHEELNGRKKFILRGFICDIIRPNKELPVQSKLLKKKNKVWKLFRTKNEDNGIAPPSLLLTVNMFQTCSNCWLWTSKCLPGSYHSHKKRKNSLETQAVVQNFNNKLEFLRLVFNYMQGFAQTVVGKY